VRLKDLSEKTGFDFVSFVSIAITALMVWAVYFVANKKAELFNRFTDGNKITAFDVLIGDFVITNEKGGGK